MTLYYNTLNECEGGKSYGSKTLLMPQRGQVPLSPMSLPLRSRHSRLFRYGTLPICSRRAPHPSVTNVSSCNRCARRVSG